MRYFTDIIILSLLSFMMACSSGAKEQRSSLQKKVILTLPNPNMEFDFNLNDYIVLRDTVKKGDAFVDIMQKQGVAYSNILEAVKRSKGVVDLRKIKTDNPYTILSSKDTIPQVCHFIYNPKPDEYYVVHLADSLYAEHKKKKIYLRESIITGTVRSTLWETIVDEKLDYNIVNHLSVIYAWTVDFFKIFKGDRFKVILTQKYVDDSIYVGINQIKAAVFEHNKKNYYAFRYNDSTKLDSYFDEKGRNLKRTFLLAPVNFTRISSRYSRKRYHPIQKRWKSHKGTDYAAPRGSPIRATADGVVIRSSYSYSNGKYVKIKHNSIYSTQYLHMSKQAVRKGQRVKQGQIIGYVGSTGLATGPHVCYRFWKNGRQVDPYRQKLPEAKSLSKNLQHEYKKFIEPIKFQLDSISY